MNTPEDLLTRVASSTDIREACEEVEDWFSRHDLVDLTTCGPQCPAWTRVVFDHDEGFDECESLHTDPPTGQPCPVMAARKEAT